MAKLDTDSIIPFSIVLIIGLAMLGLTSDEVLRIAGTFIVIAATLSILGFILKK
ncbi:MAG: hypothetical protein HYS53_01965 [Candidatus Aenigmarchaeota archaeon]|nr:hypothetical protein [Candidatus Aenigmarchaeota archaeon]